MGRDPRDVAGAWAAMRDATYWDGNGGIITFGISAPGHGALGHRGQGRRRAAVPAAGRPAPRAGAGVRVDHLRHRRPGPGRPGVRGYVEQGYRYVKGGWGHDLSIAFGRDAAARPGRGADGARGDRPGDGDDPGRGGAGGLGLRPRRRGWRGRWTRRTGCYWLEDPLPEQDIAGYQRLHAAVDTRICTGEKGWHAAHFRSLIDSGAIDVIMVDPGKAEGVTGTWRVIEMAAAAGLSWNAHSWSSRAEHGRVAAHGRGRRPTRSSSSSSRSRRRCSTSW